MMSQIFLCIFLFSGAAVVFSKGTCHSDTVEKCASYLEKYWEDNEKNLPTTEGEVEELCSHIEETAKCSSKFSEECMSPTLQELITFVSEGTVSVHNDICLTKSDIRAKLIKNAPCINGVYNSEEMKKFASYTEAGFETISTVPANQRLATVCCGYTWMRSKSYNSIEEKCGQEAIEVLEKVVEVLISSFPSLLCQGFDPESPQCIKVLPPPGATPKGDLGNSLTAQKLKQLYLP